MAQIKFSDLPAATLVELDDDDTVVPISDMAEALPADRSKKSTLGILAQWFRQIGFGVAITAASPAAVAWGFTNASGADNAAGNFTLTAPRSTGAATAATLSLATGIVAASSSTLQTATNRLSLTPNGVIFGETAASVATRANFETLGPQTIIAYGDSTIGRARYTLVTLGNAAILDTYEYNGTIAVPTASSGTLGGMWGGGYDGAAWRQAVGRVEIKVASAWSSGVAPTQIEFTTTAAGGVTPLTKLTIGADGSLTQGNLTANSTAFTSTSGSLTGSNAQTFWSYAGTWNTSGAPVGFKIAITNTASNASSLPFQVLGGASGTTSLLAVNIAGSITSAGSLTIAQTGALGFGAFGGLAASANGIFNFTDTAGTGFTRLNLGPASAAFPSLKRNGTSIEFRLADDSGYAPIVSTGATFFGNTTFTQATANAAQHTLTGGSLTGSNATTFWSYAATWNTSGAPTAFSLAITNTASNSASLLMNLLAGAGGATTMFRVDVNGNTYATGSLTSGGALNVAAASPMGWAGRAQMYSTADGRIAFMYNNGTTFGNILLGSTGTINSAARGVMALHNAATAPNAADADLVHLYCADVGAGQATFAVYQEYAPYAGVAVASTTKIPHIVNGITYYVLATTVA